MTRATDDPNRNPDGTFKKGREDMRGGKLGGRPKGSRHRLSESFLKAVADDFEAHGVGVIATLRKKHVETYGRLIVSVLPKAVELSGDDGSPLTIQIVKYADDPPAE